MTDEQPEQPKPDQPEAKEAEAVAQPVAESEEVDAEATDAFDLVTFLEEERGTAAARPITVHLRRAGGKKVPIQVDAQETHIGRDSDNDIVVKDVHVSRVHATIRRNEVGFWVIEDRGSTNGTWNREFCIQQMILDNGDRFRLGGAELTVEIR